MLELKFPYDRAFVIFEDPLCSSDFTRHIFKFIIYIANSFDGH